MLAIPKNTPESELPIGVFDSGVGGLTVLAAIRNVLPTEHLLYLGDTARLPYGTKSSDTIMRYALQTSKMLVDRRVKMLVIACNTATAAALPALIATFPDVPVIGVVEPGAKAACVATKNKNILVIGTESTIKNQAYQKAIKKILPDANVTGVACTLFVPLAEEGWIGGGAHANKEEDSIVQSIASKYLREAVVGNIQGAPDCMVLGCTHFPPLAPAIQSVVGGAITLVDSAQTTAQEVKVKLEQLSLVRKGASPSCLHFLTTDDPERFARAGSLFLGAAIEKKNLELVTL